MRFSICAGSRATIVLNFRHFLSTSADHRTLHSFPTRRSSDLDQTSARSWSTTYTVARSASSSPTANSAMRRSTTRSEEHTSELQSPDHLVCRLLLEKKNN